jgi:G3E family GTPase
VVETTEQKIEKWWRQLNKNRKVVETTEQQIEEW